MDQLINAIIDLSLILGAFAVINFILSVLVKRNDIADVQWGIGFIIICIYLYLNYDPTPLALLVYALITLWGLRLSTHIAIRNSKKSEDFRYKEWRDEWGKYVYIRSFLQIYILQTVILFIISIPVILIGVYSNSFDLGWIQYGLAVVWFIGFSWEAIADYQLLKFKSNHSGGICTTGLWKYSRHPNYFGEVVMWWSIFLFSLGIEMWYVGIISPLLLTYLLYNVSGVPKLEAKYKNNEDYKSYIDNTPAIIPFLK